MRPQPTTPFRQSASSQRGSYPRNALRQQRALPFNGRRLKPFEQAQRFQHSAFAG